MNRVYAALWRFFDRRGYEWHLRRESLRAFFDETDERDRRRLEESKKRRDVVDEEI